MIELLSYGFMQKALLGGLAIAISCGLLGPFLVLRRLSLLGDGLAHLSFGGVALGFLLGINPLLSALVMAIVGSFWVRHTLKKNLYGDAVIALLLSFGVGLGIVMIAAVRGFNSNLYSYLIGSILTLNNFDLILALSLLLAVIIFLKLFYQDMFYLTFNEELAYLYRHRVNLANIIFTLLTAMVVVISIRAVGILLISALLVIPSMIALNLASSFKQALLISSFSAMVAAISGIIVSYIVDLPPSGVIVLLLFAGFVVTSAFKKR